MTTDTPTTSSMLRSRRSRIPRWAQWVLGLVVAGVCLAILVRFYQARPDPLLLLGAVLGSLIGVAAHRRRRPAHPPIPLATGTGTVTGSVAGRGAGRGWQRAGGVLA
ncbi:MAG: hypothetical protein ACRDR6_30175, partial [Pseudonocardiaceae bacterium]